MVDYSDMENFQRILQNVDLSSYLMYCTD